MTSNRRLEEKSRYTKTGVITTLVSVLVASSIIAILYDSIHRITEGHVGIYYVNGALDSEIGLPGVHFSVPFVTKTYKIIVRSSSDIINYVDAVSKDGIHIRFKDIKILYNIDESNLINMIKEYGLEFKQILIVDRVIEHVKHWCVNKTIHQIYIDEFSPITYNVKTKVEQFIKKEGYNGIRILNILISKPEIPKEIESNYKRVKIERSNLLVAQQKQITDKLVKETEENNAIADENKEFKIAKIRAEKELFNQNVKKNISAIQNEIIMKKKKNDADIDNYRVIKEAYANEQLFSDNYVKLQLGKSLINNTKFYFSGETSPLGSLFSKFML